MRLSRELQCPRGKGGAIRTVPRFIPGSFFASSLAGAERPISEIAGDLGVMRQPLHRILAEKTPITPGMALRVGKFCGNGPDLRLRMQQAHEPWHVQKALQKQLNKIPAAGEAA